MPKMVCGWGDWASSGPETRLLLEGWSASIKTGSAMTAIFGKRRFHPCLAWGLGSLSLHGSDLPHHLDVLTWKYLACCLHCLHVVFPRKFHTLSTCMRSCVSDSVGVHLTLAAFRCIFNTSGSTKGKNISIGAGVHIGSALNIPSISSDTSLSPSSSIWAWSLASSAENSFLLAFTSPLLSGPLFTLSSTAPKVESVGATINPTTNHNHKQLFSGRFSGRCSCCTMGLTQ